MQIVLTDSSCRQCSVAARTVPLRFRNPGKTVKVHENVFVADMLMSGGYDVILGMAWLQHFQVTLN